MNVAASLDSEQQDLAREEIEGLKASRRGSQGLVLSESKTHGVSEAERWPALWIKGTRSSTEAMWHTSNGAQCFNNVPQGPTSHSFQCCSFTDSGFDLYVPSVSQTRLCVKRWTVFINTIRRDDFWGVSQRDRVVRSHLICRHRTSIKQFCNKKIK